MKKINVIIIALYIVAFRYLIAKRSFGDEWTAAFEFLLPSILAALLTFVKPKENRPKRWKVLVMASVAVISTIANVASSRLGYEDGVFYVVAFYAMALIILAILPR